MWGVSQPQSPISNHFPSPPYQNQNRRPNWQMKSQLNKPLPNHSSPSSHGQPLNSETVI